MSQGSGRGPCSGVVFCPTTAVGVCVREEVCFADAEWGDRPKMPLAWGSDAGIRNCPAAAETLLPASVSRPAPACSNWCERPSRTTAPQWKKRWANLKTTTLQSDPRMLPPNSQPGRVFDKASIDSEATLVEFKWCGLRFTAYGLRRLQPSAVGSNEAKKIRIFEAEAGGE